MSDTEPTILTDVCTLPMVRRMAAMLDRDPSSLREGDLLPHGWHPLLFNAPTRQSALRSDGAADLGVRLPDMGLPRLMLGGRQTCFPGEIAIGARVRRETRTGQVQMKEGRTGHLALVKVEHRVVVEGETQPALIEHQDYVLCAAVTATMPTGSRPPASVKCAAPPEPALAADAMRTLVPDERLLFRYSAITDNPHRIHYDAAYARDVEGYPALVVNGSIPAMFLLELFRAHVGREPVHFDSRNVAPIFCGKVLTLKLMRAGLDWRLWAEDPEGRTTFDARAGCCPRPEPSMN